MVPFVIIITINHLINHPVEHQISAKETSATMDMCIESADQPNQ